MNDTRKLSGVFIQRQGKCIAHREFVPPECANETIEQFVGSRRSRQGVRRDITHIGNAMFAVFEQHAAHQALARRGNRDQCSGR